MPRGLVQLQKEPRLVDKYVEAFANEPELKQARFLKVSRCLFGMNLCSAVRASSGGLFLCESLLERSVWIQEARLFERRGIEPAGTVCSVPFFGKLKMIFLVFVAGSTCSHEHQSEWAAE